MNILWAHQLGRSPAPAPPKAVNVFVQVSVETLSSAPASDEAGFDHVVEASLKSESGKLVLMG